jgi:hypothetical protein
LTEPEVLLHIGAMKTGTTYLQNLLSSNRGALEQQGWLVPRAPLVAAAAREVIGLTDAGAAGLGSTPTWDRLGEQVRACDGTGSIVSMEFLSYARTAQAERILAGLAGTRVSVLLTVRDAAGALPSQWQSYSRNGGAVTWPEFAWGITHRVKGEQTPVTKTFDRTQDIPRMLRVWGALMARERFTVVTVPPSSAPTDLLWQRFCAAAGVDATTTRVDDSAYGNPGLGYGSCELLRRVNAAGLRDVRPSAYRRVVRAIARQHLVPLRASESKPRLDEETARFAARLNRRTRTGIKRHAQLRGDLDDLPVRPRATGLDPGGLPAQVSDAEVWAAASVARAGALTLLEDLDLIPPAEALEPPSDLDRAIAQLAMLLRLAAGGTSG